MNHKTPIRSTAAITCTLLLGVIAPSPAAPPIEGAAHPYPPTTSLAEIRESIGKVSPQHPRLFARRSDFLALRESLKSDPLRRMAADAVISQADRLEEIPPFERTLQGRRLLGESRRCVKRTLTLSMAYQLTGEDRYVQRCKEEMLAAARFDDWNPSHFLDVAEMTFALAIGYDWLYEKLDDASRTEIRKAIIDKGVNLPFTSRHKGWVRATNNWGQVCHGGLTAGALAILEDEPELAAKTVHSALHNVPGAMAAYAPQGSYPEGPGYWAYGTSYNVILIGILESVLGSDYGLTAAPGFGQTGQYPSLVTGPSGQFFNYADGGASRQPSAELFWFASRFQRPDWLHGERAIWERSIASAATSSAASSRDRLLPLALLWMDASAATSDFAMPLHWQGGGEVPIATHRSSWTSPDAVFVGIKAGSPTANHGQMDSGSFVLDADGMRWATDLGAEGYHGIESRGMNLWSSAQDSDRWTIFRQQNHGHNTLVIDGQLQVARGHAKIIKFSDAPAFPHSVTDLTPVYSGQAKSVHRGVALLPGGEVLIQDQLEGLKPGSRVRWGMVTPGMPGDSGKPVIELRQSGKSLTLSIRSPEKGLAWKLVDTAKPRHEWDSPNPGTRMLAFEATAPESGQLSFAVLLTPGSCANPIGDKLSLKPLRAW